MQLNARHMRIHEVKERMARKPELPTVDPLLQGPRVGAPWSAPEALIAEIRKVSLEDGVRSASDYVVHLIVAALRRREAERNVDKKRR